MSKMSFEILRELFISNRSIRRFDNSLRIDNDTLKSIIELVRYCASGRNIQPLKYVATVSASQCDEIFPNLAWAGYYKDWDGPSPDERPVAYIVQCLDRNITENPMCDEGLQLEAITLGATSLGLGACIIKSFNRKRIIEIMDIPENLDPSYIVAIGYPAEKAQVVEMNSVGDYKYFRNPDDIQCVPKRALSDILVLR